MPAEVLLRAAYAANIIILAPVIAGLLFGRNDTLVTALGGQIAESEGLRLLVASLWGAILVLSAVGLAAPAPLWPLLVFQVIYKSAWLAGYVAPLWAREGAAAVPWGPTVCFALIIVFWPVVLFAAWRQGLLPAG